MKYTAKCWHRGVIACVALGAVILPSWAHATDWTRESSWGSLANELRVSPTGDLWAATASAGLQKSADAASTWSSASAGFAIEHFHALAFDSLMPLRALAGSGDQLLRTTDGGATWATVAGNFGIVNDVAFHPGALGHAYLGTDVGVWKSVDGGSTWIQQTAGVGPAVVRSLAMHPTDPNQLIVGTELGAYKTVNGGTLYSLKLTGMTHVRDPVITASQITSGNPSIVLIGCWDGVFRSTDAGETWSASTGVPATFVHQIVETSGRIHAVTTSGIYASTDSGATWTQSVATPSKSLAEPGGSLVASTTSGEIIRSTDGGATWNSATAVGGADCHSLAPGGGSSDSVYGVVTDGHGGNWRVVERDSSGTWSAIDLGSPEYRQPQHVSPDATDGDRLDVVSSGPYRKSYILSTADGGSTWTSAQLDWPNPFWCFDFVTSSADADRAMLALYPVGVTVDVNFVYVRDASTGVWSERSPLSRGVDSYFIHAVAIRDATPEELWAAGSTDPFDETTGMVALSTDGGSTWSDTAAGSITKPVISLELDGASGSTIFVGTAGAGVWSSVDGGTTWSQKGLTTATIHDLYLDTTSTPHHLYAATDAGVRYSTNGGSTWVQLGTALSSDNVRSVTVADDHVYAGTRGRGIWIIDTP